MLKKCLSVGLLIICMAALTPAFAQKKVTGKRAMGAKAPATLIHFITVKWTDEATAEQKQAALDGAKDMAGVVPGLLRVWTKKIKLQTQTSDGKAYDAIIAMEFTNEAALEAYTKHPAREKWYAIYLPIRKESRTHDVSN